MSFWKTLFSISGVQSAKPSTEQSGRPPQPDSTIASLPTGKLGFECTVPTKYATKEKCTQAVREVFAEFDSQHPGRRVAEPIEVQFSARGIPGLIDTR